MSKENQLEEALLKSIDIAQSGYGGLDRDGNIVDRRENPDAVPIKKNRAMKVPSPKKRWITTTPQGKKGGKDVYSKKGKAAF